MKCPNLGLLNAHLKIVSLALLLAACAAPEVVPPTDRELDQASLTVLREAIYTNAILEQCGSVSPELASQAEDLRQRWMADNADYLAAADAHYNQMLSNETLQYRGDPLALPAIELSHRHERRATEELKLERRSLNNQRIVCNRRLEQMANTPAKVSPDAGERNELIVQTLLSRYPQGRAVLAEAPSLGAHIERNQPPGRSYYEQLDLLKEECPSPNLKVIDNDWPHEAYGAYCEGVPIAFIECEWGECQAR